MKMYTKTGDKGISGTFTGERRLKDDMVFEALGTTDELNSAIGLAIEFSNDASHSFTSRLAESGGKSATPFHLARSICRRAERKVTTLLRAKEIDNEPLMYLNRKVLATSFTCMHFARLNDFLLTVARLAAHRKGKPEKIYRKINPTNFNHKT